MDRRRSGGPRRAPMGIAITAWATLHGLAMLSLDGQTEVTGHSVDTLVEAATELLLDGMGGPRHTAR